MLSALFNWRSDFDNYLFIYFEGIELKIQNPILSRQLEETLGLGGEGELNLLQLTPAMKD